MMKRIFALAIVVLSMPANGALLARAGGQAYYDTVLDITWLADANYAQTQSFGVTGIKESGFMTVHVADDWIAAMNSASHLGLSAWRLPDISPIDGVAFDLTFREDGSTDRGRNISAPGSTYAGSTASEMAHLYFNTLGNISTRDVDSNPTSCFGGNCLTNTGPFTGLTNQRYWSSLAPFDSGEVLYFNFNGFQEQILPDETRLGGAWAVAEGDALVPIPASVWLLGSALGLLGFRNMRSKAAA